MEARIVSRDVYEVTTKGIINIFNSMKFVELNRDKVAEIIYIIVYKDNSPRFGTVFGIKENKVAMSPFSAPYGYMETLKKEQSVEHFYEALKLVEICLKNVGISKIVYFLPPDFYDKNVIDGWYNVLLGNNWKIDCIELSFSLHIPELLPEYEERIAYNAKKNLRLSMKFGLELKECSTLEEKKNAYEVIRLNRESKGYPLRMSESQVLETMEVIPSKMYIVSANSESIAAALVYDVTEKVAMVVYWGDVPGHSEMKSINFLSYQLLKIYKERGFEYLDIGPATENGVPNWGLCNFKDSIGCDRTAKFKFSKLL